MKAVVAAFNQEKALVGAFSVITNLRMDLFEALTSTLLCYNSLPLLLLLPEDVVVVGVVMGLGVEAGVAGAGDNDLQSITITIMSHIIISPCSVAAGGWVSRRGFPCPGRWPPRPRCPAAAGWAAGPRPPSAPPAGRSPWGPGRRAH